MALAFANFKRKAPQKGGFREGWVDITLDGAYPLTGWPITAADLKLKTLHMLTPPQFRSGFGFEWDHVNGKLLAHYPQGGEQLGGATGGASVDAGAVAVTSSAVNGAIVTVDSGPSREVAASTAGLNGVVIRCSFAGW